MYLMLFLEVWFRMYPGCLMYLLSLKILMFP